MESALFTRVCAAASKGERCPQNDQISSAELSALARAGKIRIEVFERNYRVVTILEGPFKGLQTSRGHVKVGARAYVTIDAGSGTKRSSFSKEHRQAPWTPGSPKPQSD